MEDIKKTLVKLSYYYYKLGLTQGEIADKLKMSRQRVNRLLKRVRDEGIVTIHINGFSENYVDLESEIEERYNLNRAIIIPGLVDSQEVNEGLGIAGSDYLLTILKDDMNIGMSWGTTLYNVANSIPDNISPFQNVSIIQLVGSLNEGDGLTQSDEITRTVSRKLQATPYFLFAPSYVSNETVKAQLMEEESIKMVFNKMKQCDVVFYSIGHLNAYYNAISRTILTQNYDLITQNGGVGNIALRFFNEQGEFLDSAINNKVMGIDMETMKKIPEVVCVASGKKKIVAILAALRGGLMNTLITDNITARGVLEYDRSGKLELE